MAGQKSDKASKKSSSTAMAMDDALSKQKISAKVIEKMMERNINAEMSAPLSRKKAAKPLGEIASEAAAERKKATLRKPPKSAPVSAAQKTAKETARKAVAKKPRRAAPKRPPARGARKKRVSVEVVTLGAGMIHMINQSMGGVVSAGKSLACFASSVARTATETMGSGVKSTAQKVKRAPEKITGVVKSFSKSAEEISASQAKGAVTVALQTATDVTGKVADGVVKAGSSVGKATGYVVIGAVAAPFDIIRGAINITASATNVLSNLLFKPGRKAVRPQSARREKIPITDEP